MKKYFILLAVFMIAGLLSMGIYTVSPTFPGRGITEWGGGIWQFNGTFVAATDTFYFPINPPRPKSSIDTNVVALSLGAAPLSTARDTVKVAWSYQYSDDNTNWSTAVTVSTDSTKTGTVDVYTWKYAMITSYSSNGIHPYYRIRAIGGTTSGGANNIAGVKLLAFALRQYGY
jgi:hypothetical protein